MFLSIFFSCFKKGELERKENGGGGGGGPLQPRTTRERWAGPVARQRPLRYVKDTPKGLIDNYTLPSHTTHTHTHTHTHGHTHRGSLGTSASKSFRRMRPPSWSSSRCAPQDRNPSGGHPGHGRWRCRQSGHLKSPEPRDRIPHRGHASDGSRTRPRDTPKDERRLLAKKNPEVNRESKPIDRFFSFSAFKIEFPINDSNQRRSSRNGWVDQWVGRLVGAHETLKKNEKRLQNKKQTKRTGFLFFHFTKKITRQQQQQQQQQKEAAQKLETKIQFRKGVARDRKKTGRNRKKN